MTEVARAQILSENESGGLPPACSAGYFETEAKYAAIVLRNAEGRTARIDFGGDEVKFSGDLPVDEAAKIFFETVKSWGLKVTW